MARVNSFVPLILPTAYHVYLVYLCEIITSFTDVHTTLFIWICLNTRCNLTQGSVNNHYDHGDRNTTKFVLHALHDRFSLLHVAQPFSLWFIKPSIRNAERKYLDISKLYTARNNMIYTAIVIMCKLLIMINNNLYRGFGK